jgi:uncharacterized damage-inducible protein DinB
MRMVSRTVWAVRYLCGALALSAALSLVGFAQQAAGQQPAQQLKEYPTTRADSLVREWTRARDYTGEYLNAMPENGLSFKPTPEVRSFAQQMLHLAAANFNFASRISGQKAPYDLANLEKVTEYITSKAALTKVVTESYDFMISAIKGLDDAKLDLRVPLQGMNRPVISIINAAFEHQTHHRGQTTVYLRLKGATPPGEKLF